MLREMEMSAEIELGNESLERLSSLVDGELDSTAVGQACAQWRESDSARRSWHAYQLIGDVLRSDDLAADPVREAAFMQALRVRLAAEPVVLAPQALEPAPRQATSAFEAQAVRGARWGWLAPSAVAAGFVVAAGVLMVSRTPGPLPGGAQGVALAGAAPATSASTAASVLAGTDPQIFVANGALIRDARLDSYLAAHKQFAGTSALGVPSAFLRSATVDGSDR